MAEDEQKLDAGIADASLNTLQIVASVDAGHLRDCEELDPFEILPAGIAAKVKLVLNGDNCQRVFVREGVNPDCELPEISNARSQFRFKGLMVFFEGDVMDLRNGEIYYQAFRSFCDEYPNTVVKIVGLELKPGGDSGETAIRAKIEEGEDGTVLVRVHLWNGEVHVQMEGETILKMVKDMQATISPSDGKIVEVFSTSPQSTTRELTPAEFNGSESGQKRKKTEVRKAETGVPDGCNVNPTTTNALVDPLMGGIAIFALLRALSKPPK